jgi:hypothetical protein
MGRWWRVCWGSSGRRVQARAGCPCHVLANLMRRIGFILVLVLAAASARGASPVLSSVLPRGGQRGTEVEVTLGGDRLGDAKEILFYEAGLRVVKLEVVNPQQVKAKVAIAADAATGEHALRVRTSTGISELRTFWVGSLPEVAEKEPNSDFSQPQKIDLNVTVTGMIESEDVDYFVVEAKKGQRITAEIEALRLGTTLFDPYLAILDENRFELCASDDAPLLLQDSLASIIAPKDGTYVIQLRDASYGGSASHQYRLHVGTFPRPRAVYPAGGQGGEEIAATFVGDVAGRIAQKIKLRTQPSEAMGVTAQQNGQSAPSANVVRVSPFGNVLEAEPNNDVAHASAAADVPVAFNGIISEKGDVDWFRFKAKKDQQLDVNIYARRIRSGLDPILVICDAKGNGIASNDDSAGPDSYLRFAVPADGEYTLYVTDHLQRGEADFVYRVEVVPARAAVAVAIPLVAANSQERQTIVVPRGNRFATMVRATRADYAGDVVLSAAGLPAGVTMQADPVPAGLDAVPVVFEAAADAPSGGAALCDLVAKAADGKTELLSRFAQTADLIVYGNQIAFYQAKVNKLAVALADEAPFKLKIVQPKVPVVQSGSMQLKIVAERKEGFKAPISVQMPFNPPGVGSGPVTIPEGANEVMLPISCAGDAQVRKWKVCVLGSAEAGGAVWVSSPLTELEVAPPLVTMKIEMTAAEQGKAATVLCNVEQKTPFAGKAKAQLLGLPPNATAGDVEFTSSDAKVVFDVKTDAKTPAGQHASLFCSVTVSKDGESIVQSAGQGGVLRVDPPAPAPAAAAAAAPATAPAVVAAAAAKPGADQKPLSRLEKLRLEQAQRVK